ncbi:hypothetical protein C1645_790644 [Glomus cerebriforme]|uniref:Uncharacterized protein n=1 Tax=Glomus cerebriforme TaxID=658196 RepID=A0A397SEY7_9GLOM|nr:hypothetical protein C1645_790644 [Glomus cerebriforme]
MKRIMELMIGYCISTMSRTVLVIYHRLAFDFCNLFLYRSQYLQLLVITYYSICSRMYSMKFINKNSP